MDQGEQLKLDGMDRVESNNKSFVERMRYVARLYICATGLVSCDDLRRYAEREGINPAHPNAWGSIFRGRGWVAVGWRKSRLPSNHGRMIRTWTWTTKENP